MAHDKEQDLMCFCSHCGWVDYTSKFSKPETDKLVCPECNSERVHQDIPDSEKSNDDDFFPSEGKIMHDFY